MVRRTVKRLTIICFLHWLMRRLPRGHQVPYESGVIAGTADIPPGGLFRHSARVCAALDGYRLWINVFSRIAAGPDVAVFGPRPPRWQGLRPRTRRICPYSGEANVPRAPSRSRRRPTRRPSRPPLHRSVRSPVSASPPPRPGRRRDRQPDDGGNESRGMLGEHARGCHDLPSLIVMLLTGVAPGPTLQTSPCDWSAGRHRRSLAGAIGPHRGSPVAADLFSPRAQLEVVAGVRRRLCNQTTDRA